MAAPMDAEAGARLHRDRHFADEVSGVGRHHGGAEDAVGAPPDVDAGKAGVLAVEHRAVDIGEGVA